MSGPTSVVEWHDGKTHYVKRPDCPKCKMKEAAILDATRYGMHYWRCWSWLCRHTWKTRVRRK